MRVGVVLTWLPAIASANVIVLGYADRQQEGIDDAGHRICTAEGWTDLGFPNGRS